MTGLFPADVQWLIPNKLAKSSLPNSSDLVHCYAGIGRTGTVLLAYLVSTGVDLLTAVEKVLQVGAYPQSPAQKKIIELYYQEQLNLKSG